MEQIAGVVGICAVLRGGARAAEKMNVKVLRALAGGAALPSGDTGGDSRLHYLGWSGYCVPSREEQALRAAEMFIKAAKSVIDPQHNLQLPHLRRTQDDNGVLKRPTPF